MAVNKTGARKNWVLKGVQQVGYERGMWDTNGKVAKEQTAVKGKPRGKKGESQHRRW